MSIKRFFCLICFNFISFSFRGILDGLSNVMGARSMKWELDALYPGLQMRVGAYHGMNSVLEFVLDPDQDVDSGRKAFYASESPSVGKSKKELQRRRPDEESSPYLSPPHLFYCLTDGSSLC